MSRSSPAPAASARRALISGAGIAGPALAFWLGRAGWDVTVVERAAAPRTGGQAVDFRGPVHRAVLERMGLWDAIAARRTPHNTGLALVDADGARFGTLPAFVLGGDVEIARGALSALLIARSEESGAAVRYRFGDHVTAIDDVVDAPAGEERALVRFARAAPARFDLVVAADGLHSSVRGLAFGAARARLVHLGYRVASFDVPAAATTTAAPASGVMWAVPGAGATVTDKGDGVARATLFYPAPPLAERAGAAEALRAAFAPFAGRWCIGALLAALEHAVDPYFDDIALVDVDAYAAGRVVLLGDAAWGATLGGQGAPLALLGACVLAHELSAHGDDVGAACAAYEARVRPYAAKAQQGARHVGGFHAPKTQLALLLRNTWMRAFTSRPLLSLFERIVTRDDDDFALPERREP